MKMKSLATAIFLLNVFLGSWQAHSQQPADAMQLVKRVSEAYRSLGSYEIRAVVITDQRWGEARQLSEVPQIMAEDKPGKFRLESKHPFMGSMEVSDGKTTWVYTGMGHQYVQKPANSGADAAGDSPMINAMMPVNYVENYRQLQEKVTAARLLPEQTLSLEGREAACAVLEVEFGGDKAKKQKTEESPHTLWIDKGTALVLQEMWDDKADRMGVSSQTRTTVVYKSIHIAKPIPAELFSFTPPPNAREVDDLAMPGASAKRAALSGQSGPEFTLSSLEGKKVSLSDFKGKPVLLDFWATWCVPCRESTPLVEKVGSTFSSKGLVTLAVDYGEEPAVVKGYLAHNPSSLRNLVDPDKTAADLYRVNSVPALILISKDGKIAYRSSGFGDDTEAALRAALKAEGLE